MNTIMTYRGYTITDAPSVDPRTQHTILDPAGKVVEHWDEETLAELLDTIDIVIDERRPADEDPEELPKWRQVELAARSAHSKLMLANYKAADGAAKLEKAITEIGRVIAALQAETPGA